MCSSFATHQQVPMFKITGARPPQLKCWGGLCPPCPRGSYSPDTGQNIQVFAMFNKGTVLL